MPVPHEEEQRLVEGLAETGETVVAYALLPRDHPQNQ
jgi:hypothetical protein